VNNLFLDTNVLLDVLDHREPFYGDSAAIWSLAEKGKIRGHISAISFNNIYYILRKQQSQAVIRKTLCLLRDIFDIVMLDERILNQAIDSNFKDFEDAIQYFSASRVNAQCLLSRNLNHYKASEIPILTPTEFLASNSAQ
jgi:predicted nucleic acid-binding protein